MRATFLRPRDRRQLRGRLQAALGDQREADPFDRVGIDAPTLGRRPQCVSDAQPFPQLVEDEGAAEPTGVDDLDVGPGNGRARRRQIENPADRRDEPCQRLLVDLVLPAEVVDDLGHR